MLFQFRFDACIILHFTNNSPPKPCHLCTPYPLSLPNLPNTSKKSPAFINSVLP